MENSQTKEEISSSQEENNTEEVINAALREPPAMPQKGERFNRCVICKRIVLNKNAIGEFIGEQHQSAHLKIDCTHKTDSSRHTILYICGNCRFNQILVSKVSQALQGIFASRYFKAINCQHE